MCSKTFSGSVNITTLPFGSHQSNSLFVPRTHYMASPIGMMTRYRKALHRILLMSQDWGTNEWLGLDEAVCKPHSFEVIITHMLSQRG